MKRVMISYRLRHVIQTNKTNLTDQYNNICQTSWLLSLLRMNKITEKKKKKTHSIKLSVFSFPWWWWMMNAYLFQPCENKTTKVKLVRQAWWKNKRCYTVYSINKHWHALKGVGISMHFFNPTPSPQLSN